MKTGKYLILFFGLIFLPETGRSVVRTWYQKAHIGGEARHRCTAFSIGNKGYYGGGHVNSGETITYKDYWEYDPATNSWSQIADFGGGLRYHSSAFTIDGYAYVGCGENSTSNYTNDFWKYVPEVNTWFPIANLPSTPRRGGTAFSISGKGYYGLGQSDDGYHTDFYTYDPATNVWTAIADFIGEARSAAVSFTHNAKGYVGTGHKIGEALNDFYEYDPLTNTWTVKANVGGSIRQDAMAFMIDGKGYIGTGNDNLGNDFKDIWEYDFSTNIWTQINDFGGQKRRYATTFTIENIVYLAGGTNGTNFKDCWAFAPSVSIFESLSENFTIQLFPNPSTEKITISTNLPNDLKEKFSYTVVNIQGKTILKGNFTNQNQVFYKNQFETGIYILNVFLDGEYFTAKKFVFN